MSFRPIWIKVGDKDGKVVDDKTTLGMYAIALHALPPQREVFLDDPDYDVQTLNSSLSFRAEILKRFPPPKDPFMDLKITWEDPERHKLDPTGKYWEKGDGVGVRYPITGELGGPYYICIQFDPKS